MADCRADNRHRGVPIVARARARWEEGGGAQQWLAPSAVEQGAHARAAVRSGVASGQRWRQRAWVGPAVCEGHAVLSPCCLRLSRRQGGEMPSKGGHTTAVHVIEVASGARARSTGRSGREWAKALQLGMTSPRRPLRVWQSSQAEGTGQRGRAC
jgi:hypothetical protein